MKRRALAALVVLAASAMPMAAQQTIAIAAKVGVTQPVLVGVLANPPVTRTKVKGTTITGTTTAIVRANVPWALRVSLVAPVSPILTAKFRLGNARTVELSAKQPTAIVTTGPRACARCAVTLDWTFEYDVKGKTRFTPTVPALLFQALSVRR